MEKKGYTSSMHCFSVWFCCQFLYFAGCFFIFYVFSSFQKHSRIPTCHNPQADLSRTQPRTTFEVPYEKVPNEKKKKTKRKKRGVWVCVRGRWGGGRGVGNEGKHRIIKQIKKNQKEKGKREKGNKTFRCKHRMIFCFDFQFS